MPDMGGGSNLRGGEPAGDDSHRPRRSVVVSMDSYRRKATVRPSGDMAALVTSGRTCMAAPPAAPTDQSDGVAVDAIKKMRTPSGDQKGSRQETGDRVIATGVAAPK